MHAIELTDARIQIDRPANEVFSYVSDLENFMHWFPEVRTLKASNALPPDAVGRRYLEQVAIPGRGVIAVNIEVVHCGDHSLVTEGDLEPLLPRMRIDVEAASPSACAVRWRMWSRSESALVRGTVAQLMKLVIRRRARIGLARLRERMEGSDGGS